jgi:hypothetical protein
MEGSLVVELGLKTDTMVVFGSGSWIVHLGCVEPPS